MIGSVWSIKGKTERKFYNGGANGSPLVKKKKQFETQ